MITNMLLSPFELNSRFNFRLSWTFFWITSNEYEKTIYFLSEPSTFSSLLLMSSLKFFSWTSQHPNWFDVLSLSLRTLKEANRRCLRLYSIYGLIISIAFLCSQNNNLQNKEGKYSQIWKIYRVFILKCCLQKRLQMFWFSIFRIYLVSMYESVYY